MDPVTTAATINAGATLAAKYLEVKGKTTFSWLEGQKAKARNAESPSDAQSIYEETINRFQESNADLENIARGYKDLYEQIVISDDDIEFLNATLRNALKILSELGDIKEDQIETFNSMINLINKDLLKSMQLLGFNYKEAIGIPLTLACSNFILAKLGSNSSPSKIPTDEFSEELFVEGLSKLFGQPDQQE